MRLFINEKAYKVYSSLHVYLVKILTFLQGFLIFFFSFKWCIVCHPLGYEIYRIAGVFSRPSSVRITQY